MFGFSPTKGVILPSSRAANNGDGSIGFVFDVVIHEAPEFTATPSRSPLEDGSSATDHINIEPIKLMLDVLIPAVPLYKATGLELSGLGGIPDSIRRAHQTMKSLRGQVVDIVAGFEVYSSMTLVSYTPSRNARTGNVLQFTSLFEEIRYVSSSSVTIPQEHQDKKGAPAKQDIGKKPAPPPTVAEEKKLQSYLAKGIDATGWGI